jgi:hypothetical protein
MKQFSRRDFLAGTSAAAGLMAATSWTVGDEKPSRSPNEKLNIAIIGSGGRGGSNLKNVSSEQITVLCDVNQQNLSPHCS